MTVLLICAAVVALIGADLIQTAGVESPGGLALIAVALCLAWKAGGEHG